MLSSLDARTALALAATLGFDARAVLLLLPSIEAGLWAAVAQDVTTGVDDEKQ